MNARIILLALMAAFVACSIEAPNTSEEFTKPPRFVFDISVTVEGRPATRGVKTAWEVGDVVYVFFEHNNAQFVKMTYDGSVWSCTDKNGETSFSGLSLSHSGSCASAVYFPPFVNGTDPVWSSSDQAFVFPDARPGYFLKAEKVPYTVTTAGDINGVKASLHLKAPAGFIQLYVVDDAPQPDTWLMTERNIAPAVCGLVVPGGVVSLDQGSYGRPLAGLPATVDGAKGYYFYGILNPSCRGVPAEYHFQMVMEKEWNGYRCVSSIKAKAPVTATMYTMEGENVENAAFRLGSWQDSYFLDLGFGSVKWAIGNLQEAEPYIAYPLDKGDYYMWCKTTPYYQYDAVHAGNYVMESTDAAYAKNAAWRLPLKSEIEELRPEAGNVQWDWVPEESGTDKGSYLVTSKKNGLSMVLRAAGYHIDGRFSLGDLQAVSIWSSSPGTADGMGCALVALGPGAPVNPSAVNVGDCFRRMGMAIRPVMER